MPLAILQYDFQWHILGSYKLRCPMVCAAFPLANVRQLLRFNVMAVDLRLANTHMLLLSQHDGSTLLVRWLGKSFQLLYMTNIPDGVLRLLASAERNLADARLSKLSNDNRFDAAYKTIMQCAMVGLWANGYRTATSQPGGPSSEASWLCCQPCSGCWGRWCPRRSFPLANSTEPEPGPRTSQRLPRGQLR